MASIFEVAKRANVSPSTVSLVLNHRHLVRAPTRSRVGQSIQQLGYQSTRQRLATERKRFAFIYPHESMCDERSAVFCREIIQHVQAAVRDLGFLSIIRDSDHDLILKQQIKNQKLDGFILFGPVKSSAYIDRLKSARIPFVIFNQPLSPGRFGSVTLDYFGAGRQAIDQLVKADHHKIACIFDDDDDAWPSRELLNGSLARLEQLKLTPYCFATKELLVNGARIDTFCRDLLRSGITAVFTEGQLTVQIANALDDMGIQIPKAFSIIGFDHQPLVMHAGLCITSIGYDKRNLAFLAVEMLKQMLQNDNVINWTTTAVETDVLRGQTVGKRME